MSFILRTLLWRINDDDDDEDLQIQGIAGSQPSVPKRYKELKARVQNTVDTLI